MALIDGKEWISRDREEQRMEDILNASQGLERELKDETCWTREEKLLKEIRDNVGLGGGSNQEVVDARNDFWGKTHDNLKARVDSDFEFAHVDNSKGMFLEMQGEGSITAKNSLEGKVKSLVVYGNTIGGYDSVTSTSSPLESVGEAENGLLRVKTTGKNKANLTKYELIKSYNNIPPLLESISQDSFSFKPAGIDDWTGLRFKVPKCELGNTISFKVTSVGTSKDIAWITDGGRVLIELGKTLVINSTNSSYFSIVATGRNTLFNVEFVQIEQGDISTEYEPYVESITQVQITDFLKSSSDTNRDTYNLDTGIFTKNVLTRPYEVDDELNAEVITDKVNTNYKNPNPNEIQLAKGSIDTFKGTTTLSIETEVQASLKGQFPVQVQGFLSTLNKEHEEILTENRQLKTELDNFKEETRMIIARMAGGKPNIEQDFKRD